MKYIIKTFGCQQNKADSERIACYFKSCGMMAAKNYQEADYIVINTCMIRESAENRVYGLINNLKKLTLNQNKFGSGLPRTDRRRRSSTGVIIILTGCMVGMAFRDKTGKYLKKIEEKLPEVDEFMPIEEIGFDFVPLRTDKLSAWVPISNGCNNFCTYCVVPFTRGREISRPFDEIINECKILKKRGYRTVTLLGQTVNSYGSDLISEKAKIPFLRQSPGAPLGVWRSKKTVSSFINNVKPVYVKHLGKYRIPTLFPHLLEEVSKMGFEKVDFMSSNPWDFSNELIDVIARNKNITRTLHLPVQSGDDAVLKRMNRWYSAKEYLLLISKIKDQISKIKFTTDIIVGFCGETEKEFENTLKLCKKAGFSWAYVSVYSQRPMAASTKIYKDDVPHEIKDKRWKILDDLINKPHLKNRG